MLTVGDKFPDFAVKGVVSTNPQTAFTTSTRRPTRANGRSCSSGRRTSPSSAPPRSPASASSTGDFADRDAQLIYGVSTDSEFVHLAWRQNHADLRNLPFRCSPTSSASFRPRSAFSTSKEGVAQARDLYRRSRRHHPLRLGHRHERRTQSAGSAARARCAADRRALPLQLAERRSGPGGCVIAAG